MKTKKTIKQLASVLLCCALLLPSLLMPQTALAEESDRVIGNIPFTFSSTVTIPSGRQIITSGKAFTDTPIDLTAYTNRLSDVSLEFDFYIKGDVEMVKAANGQIELTSGGKNDLQEINYSVKKLTYAEGWTRYNIPLSDFSQDSASGAIDWANINFFRMYLVSVPENYVGQKITVKIWNVRLVDNTKGPATDPIGDGSVEPRDPEWKLAPTKYPTEDVIVMGYNLLDYLPDHEQNPDRDVTSVIQSLLDALEANGGGTLFIPEGQYVVRGRLIIPRGVTICGDWKKPDGQSPIQGTILKAYYGKGSRRELDAFITLQANSMIRDIAIWYPEQQADVPVAYPPTIRMFDETQWGNDYEHVRNVTLVNSFIGIKQGYPNEGSFMTGCPNITNVYGTILNTGIDMDLIADVGRFDYMHFSPDYWIHSGLPGAPSSEETAAKVRSYMRDYGTGIILRRIDWSYLTYSHVEGYNIGMYFGHSQGDGGFPNGQCYGLTFTDCETAIMAEGISRAGELLSDIVIDNCNNGFVLLAGVNYPNEAPDSSLLVYNSTINVSDYAVLNESPGRSVFTGSTIEQGMVYSSNGTLVLSDNTFKTQGPQITLDYGAKGAVILGNRFEKVMKIDNPGHCPVELDTKSTDATPIPSLPVEKTVKNLTKPAVTNKLYVVEADRRGNTDATAAIQAKLDEAANTGGVVFLPPGEYRLSGSLTIPTGVELKGAVDLGRNPYNTGTILHVYGGKDDPSAPPTIQMREKSGIRGIVFNYPEQFAESFTSLDSIHAFPYAIQGQGKDIYIINVALRNGYNGIDLATYRCDNHYVNYVAGIALKNMIKVGNGATGGLIANYQLNYTTLLNGAESKYGSWGSSPDTSPYELPGNPDINTVKKAFEQIMYKYMQENTVVMEVGHVVDQVLYDNFSYSGYIGIKFISENGKIPSGICVGHGIDFATVALQFETAVDMPFINSQLTAFNKVAAPRILDVEAIHDIYLTNKASGEINFYNVSMWGNPDPNPSTAREGIVSSFIRSDSGTLNMYNGNFHARSKYLATIRENGKINLMGGLIRNESAFKQLLDGPKGNLSMSGYLLRNSVEGLDGLQYNMIPPNRWNVPLNADIPASQKVVFAESFDDYPNDNGTLRATDSFNRSNPTADSYVKLATIDFEQVAQFWHSKDAAVALLRNPTLNLKTGQENSVYYMEARVNVSKLPQTQDAFFGISVNWLQDGSSIGNLLIVAFDGNKAVMVNEKKLAGYETDTWYRVRAEFQLQNASSLRYQVTLLDDEYTQLAQSGWITISEFAGADSMAFPTVELTCLDTVEQESEAFLDYLVFTQKGDNQELGDINCDGVINITDARLALQAAVKKITLTAEQALAADVNGSGAVEVTDARLILQYVVKKIPSFPI